MAQKKAVIRLDKTDDRHYITDSISILQYYFPL